MDDDGHDCRMSLQYHGGISVWYAGDDDGVAFVYPVPEAAYFMAGIFGLYAGRYLFAVVSVSKMNLGKQKCGMK